jgi:pimeloyl-ACP methyl ester carboxylesterase
MVGAVRVTAVCAASVLVLLAACASDSASPSAGSSTAPSSSGSASRPTGDTPTGSGSAVVEGTFDVGGHRLFITCEGTGSPTVVYLHGSISDPAVDPHANGGRVQERLSEDYRVCLYDRRNLGHSDTVNAPQLPGDAVHDLHRLLTVAEIDPPYVLLGASFGGMLSYLYANQHPDEVVGMVLLDAMFPDELSLEHLFDPADRYQAFDQEDEASLERISHYKVQKAAQRYVGREPEIPVVYLASEVEGYEDNDYGIPEYDRRILQAQAAYVDRFSPGTLVTVDAPHFMEPVIPDQIADAVRDVIDLQSSR